MNSEDTGSGHGNSAQGSGDVTLAGNLVTDTGMEPAGGTRTPTGMEPAGGARAASEIHEVEESPEKVAPAAGSASVPEIGQGSDLGATRILEFLEEPQLEPTLPETVPGEDGQQLGATVRSVNSSSDSSQ